MKKFLLVLLTLGMMSFTSDSKLDQSNKFYRRVDVYNINNRNILDFVFTYDRFRSCYNNLLIENNLGIRLKFKFDIYLDGHHKASGWADIQPHDTLYFNDLFYDCNSARKRIRVKTY